MGNLGRNLAYNFGYDNSVGVDRTRKIRQSWSISESPLKRTEPVASSAKTHAADQMSTEEQYLQGIVKDFILFSRLDWGKEHEEQEGKKE